MDDLVVNAGAKRRRVSVVMQEGRDRVILSNQLFGVNVQRRRGHAGLDRLAELLQHLVEKCASRPHFRNLVGIFYADHAFAPKTFRMSA